MPQFPVLVIMMPDHICEYNYMFGIYIDTTLVLIKDCHKLQAKTFKIFF